MFEKAIWIMFFSLIPSLTLILFPYKTQHLATFTLFPLPTTSVLVPPLMLPCSACIYVA